MTDASLGDTHTGDQDAIHMVKRALDSHAGVMQIRRDLEAANA